MNYQGKVAKTEWLWALTELALVTGPRLKVGFPREGKGLKRDVTL